MRFRRLSLVAAACLFTLSLAHSPAAEPGGAAPSGFLARADVFPVGVWLQDPANAPAYKAIGINFYAGLWDGPTERQLRDLMAAGMAVFAPQNDLARQSTYSDIIAGWIMPDEPDNAQQKDGGGFGPPVPPQEVVRLYQEMKARDPDRPVLLNLGQGVAWDVWHGRGTRTNHPEDYKTYVGGGDILSFDIYPFTHSDRSVRGRLDYVARGVDRLIRWSGGAKPVWSVIEASGVSNPDLAPSGDDVRRLVWLSIIHGARGIIYFVHQFRPYFIEASLLQNEALSRDIAAINARLQSLAPVLNSPDLDGAVAIETDAATPGSVVAIARQDDCHIYIFAGSISRFPVPARIRLSLPVTDGPTEVLDEQRLVTVSEGGFSDHFDSYATHLYKVAREGRNCTGEARAAAGK
ncbi:hypothetical protein [Sneathiella sp.]|uniref:hypothetical protein n=1 Tax=Sneathiella sp. TaxID=1964365 RepID=UPI002FE1A108